MSGKEVSVLDAYSVSPLVLATDENDPIEQQRYNANNRKIIAEPYR